MNEAVGQILREVFNKPVKGALLVKAEYKLPLIYFYNVWVCFGAQILIYSGAMDQISPDILEAGQVDGVNSIREFFSIVIPIILPTVATFFIASVATLFTNQANLYIMFSNSADTDVASLGYHLFNITALRATEANFPQAAAIGIIFTLCTVPIVMFLRWGLGKIDPDVQY
jgi:ABC-type sugar transport system permease subunit